MACRQGGADNHPLIPCWFCDERVTRRQIVRDGIIRSRSEELGGPFRLLACPSCGRENLCEKTSRGRWFSSPNFRFSFFDYLFSQILDPGAEDLLAAITWFRNNEERRRYFFEKDGDRRYSGRSFLLRLWPMAKVETAERRRAGGKARPRGAASHREEDREEARGERLGPRPVVSPYEILGVAPDASERDIRLAFHRLAVQYHPDKVHHLGEKFQRHAHEKFTRLKAAYETLLVRRARQAR